MSNYIKYECKIQFIHLLLIGIGLLLLTFISYYSLVHSIQLDLLSFVSTYSYFVSIVGIIHIFYRLFQSFQEVDNGLLMNNKYSKTMIILVQLGIQYICLILFYLTIFGIYTFIFKLKFPLFLNISSYLEIFKTVLLIYGLVFCLRKVKYTFILSMILCLLLPKLYSYIFVLFNMNVTNSYYLLIGIILDMLLLFIGLKDFS